MRGADATRRRSRRTSDAGVNSPLIEFGFYGGKRRKVGPARFGLATSRLSAGRSNRAKLRARGGAEGMNQLKRSLRYETGDWVGSRRPAIVARTPDVHGAGFLPDTERTAAGRPSRNNNPETLITEPPNPKSRDDGSPRGHQTGEEREQVPTGPDTRAEDPDRPERGAARAVRREPPAVEVHRGDGRGREAQARGHGHERQAARGAGRDRRVRAP